MTFSASPTLTYSPTSFVDESLKEVFADIVFTCQLEDGTDALCTIIIEHKSYDDPHVAFQLLGYMSRSYLQQIKNKESISAVVPLLFCHHSHSYEYKTIETFFNRHSSGITEFIPKFKVVIFNVHDLDDEMIFNIRNVAISTMLLTQKHINNPIELLNKLSKIFESLQTQEERNFFNSNYVYTMMIAEQKNIDLINIIQIDIDKPLNKYYMTLVEEYKLKNKLEGKIEVVLTMIDDKMPLDQISRYTQLTIQEVIDILKAHGKYEG